MAGGFAVIKDVPEDARVRAVPRPQRARRAATLIPEAVIEKPPSAELRPDQLDSDSLPAVRRCSTRSSRATSRTTSRSPSSMAAGYDAETRARGSRGSSTATSTSAARRRPACGCRPRRSARTGGCRSPTAGPAERRAEPGGDMRRFAAEGALVARGVPLRRHVPARPRRARRHHAVRVPRCCASRSRCSCSRRSRSSSRAARGRGPPAARARRASIAGRAARSAGTRPRRRAAEHVAVDVGVHHRPVRVFTPFVEGGRAPHGAARGVGDRRDRDRDGRPVPAHRRRPRRSARASCSTLACAVAVRGLDRVPGRVRAAGCTRSRSRPCRWCVVVVLCVPATAVAGRRRPHRRWRCSRSRSPASRARRSRCRSSSGASAHRAEPRRADPARRSRCSPAIAGYVDGERLGAVELVGAGGDPRRHRDRRARPGATGADADDAPPRPSSRRTCTDRLRRRRDPGVPHCPHAAGARDHDRRVGAPRRRARAGSSGGCFELLGGWVPTTPEPDGEARARPPEPSPRLARRAARAAAARRPATTTRTRHVAPDAEWRGRARRRSRRRPATGERLVAAYEVLVPAQLAAYERYARRRRSRCATARSGGLGFVIADERPTSPRARALVRGRRPVRGDGPSRSRAAAESGA